MPLKVLKITKSGIIVSNPKILGKIRNEAEFTPMISSASICWEVRIVPNSEAIFDPTFPARIKHMMELENSSSIISRVVYPETHSGIHGDWMFNFIWIQITAPMKNEMSKTMPMESTPSCSISFRYCLKNIRIRSGRENVRPINWR